MTRWARSWRSAILPVTTLGGHIAEGTRRAAAFRYRMTGDQVDGQARQRVQGEATAQAIAAIIVEAAAIVQVLDEAVAVG